MVTISY